MCIIFFRHLLSVSVVFLFAVNTLFAQMQLGMRWERRAGIYTTALNPAFSAYQPSPWDVSLGSLDLYADNDHFYLKNAKIPYVLRQLRTIANAVDIDREKALRDAFDVGFYNGSRPVYLIGAARFGGPSFSFRVGKKHTFGVETALRTYGGSYNIPAALRYAAVQNVRTVTLSPSDFALLSWGEVGLHYSYGTELSNGLYLTAGVTPKLLLGYQGLLARNLQTITVDGVPGDSVSVRNMDVLYGFTNDLANVDPNGQVQAPSEFRGRGWGLDVGFSIARPDGDSPDDYKWRLGVSLVDVGHVFFPENSEMHRIEIGRPLLVNQKGLNNPDNLRDAVQQISQTFLGDPNASRLNSHLGLRLPMVFSLQADYKIVPMVYAGAILTQRIPGGASLQSPSFLAVAPRFEHQWGAVTLPVMVTDWRKVRVGLAARLAFFTLGTDNLGSWLGQSKLSGGDLYAGVKINGFRLHGNANNNTRSKRKRGGDCYRF